MLVLKENRYCIKVIYSLQTVKAMNNGGNGQQQGIDLFKLADFVAAGFLFGLIVTGQFNLFEGPLQFISGITLVSFCFRLKISTQENLENCDF